MECATLTDTKKDVHRRRWQIGTEMKKKPSAIETKIQHVGDNVPEVSDAPSVSLSTPSAMDNRDVCLLFSLRLRSQSQTTPREECQHFLTVEEASRAQR